MSISNYFGAWPAGYGPSIDDIKAGTGAVQAYQDVISESGVEVAQAFTGLPDADYDLEWVAVDGDQATTTRSNTVAVTIGSGFAITDVYAEATGEAPIYWMETAIAEGTFGPNEGLVYVHTSRANVISWTNTRIEFTPVPNGLPAGTYDIHVDRVL